MFKKHKKIFITLTLIMGYIIWSQTYSYNIDKATNHAEKHHCHRRKGEAQQFAVRKMFREPDFHIPFPLPTCAKGPKDSSF